MGLNGNGRSEHPPSLLRGFAIAGGARASFFATGPHVYLLSQPQGQTVSIGGIATFSVVATGSGALSYQWKKDGAVIAGATGSTYSVSNVQTADGGRYSVTVTDGAGSFTSNAATLGVSATTVINSRLYAISCRAMVGTGGDILIPGIAIGGSGSRQVIVRASGPAIQGVAGTLVRPQLQLYQAGVGTPIATNAGWDNGTDAAALRAAFSEANLPQYASGSADCALLATLNAGAAYTAQVSGLGASPTGVALVEVYELGSSSARMTALSCRARVGSGGDILIPGVIILGGSPKQVIIRAAGPALAAQGVPGALAQLQLQLYDSSGTKIAENIGWGNASNLSGLVAATTASGLQPFAPGSADCALLVTLPPGGYTAQVSGLNSTTGVALIEIYEVP